jgi:hypothetical protein
LSYREAIAIVAISFFIMSFVIAGNGAVGAIYHVPFPVIARASWGFWGSYVAIVSRVILAIFWFAIQNVNGGNAVRVMIGAIWPSYLNLPNGIPASQGITTNGMVGFLIFWIVQFPFLCIHPNKLRWLFAVKSVLVPIAWIAILIWAFVAEKGGGGVFAQQTATAVSGEYDIGSGELCYSEREPSKTSLKPRPRLYTDLTIHSLIFLATLASTLAGSFSIFQCCQSSSPSSPSSVSLLHPLARPTTTLHPFHGTRPS